MNPTAVLAHCDDHFFRIRQSHAVEIMFFAEIIEFGGEGGSGKGILRSLGSPGLPWAAQVRKKRQNLVRGSPTGSPKGGQRGPKSDQNEVKGRKKEGRGP